LRNANNFASQSYFFEHRTSAELRDDGVCTGMPDEFHHHAAKSYPLRPDENCRLNGRADPRATADAFDGQWPVDDDLPVTVFNRQGHS
jgi:hypothetical protein